LQEREQHLQSTIFETMANANISVDFISVSLSEVIFTVPNDTLKKAVSLLQEQKLNVDVTKNCAKVSAVGAGMSGIPGVVSKIMGALVIHDVDVLQSADSHTTIWVLIDDKHIKTAINALHDVFE